MEFLRGSTVVSVIAKENELINKKWIELESGCRLYPLLTKYIACNAENSQSFRADVTASSNAQENGCDVCCEESQNIQQDSILTKSVGRISFECGLGNFTFPDHKGNKLTAIHQRVGDPVGTDCGVKIFTSLVIYTERDIDDLANFFTYLVEISEKCEEGVFSVFKWHVRYHYWKKGSSCKARPIDSVILPDKIKNSLLNDVSTFLSAKSKLFYQQHGIPYRRSYLFYGVPGSGKTSLIQALAGHFKRSVSFVQPSDPEMTDDSLSDAVSQLPQDTIVVFEDIDSLFDVDRSNKVSKSSLTFSGLLNALDGVGSSNGQIFILTTNLLHQLDSALTRKGRVDVQIEFTYAQQEQMEAMWKSFYSSSSSQQAAEFSSKLLQLLKDNNLNNVTTAGLQHFFVMNMYKSAEDALKDVDSIIADLKSTTEDNNSAAKTDSKENDASSSSQKNKDKKKKKSAIKNSSQQVHIHLHGNSNDSVSDSEEES